jgi:flagellar M-ring protein FliF
MSEQEVNNLVQTEPQQNILTEDRGYENAHPAMKGMLGLPVAKQLGLMLGLALSVAIGVAVVLWSQAGSYSLLFASVGEKDAAEILQELDKLGIDYKVETGSGAIMVPAGELRVLKLKLAALGLPKSNSLGYELLDKETGFGSSKSVEKVRFQRALEGEIARTIMSLQNVKNARVLLALPKQSVFVRKRKKPSAAVTLELYQGRTLEKAQVEAIVHLVASSVPLLETEQVTVVDQKGRLLNAKNSSSEMYLTSKRFEYKKQIEEHLMERIENILSPIVGGDGMRAQISADVDFTVTEKTQEMFNPDLPALRSEQTSEELNTMSVAQGVPGALSNQPPPAGIAPEVAVAENVEQTGEGEQTPTSTSKSATRNFELDKTITHTRMANGVIRRLSVAVVVDNQFLRQEDGSYTSRPYSQEDINRFSELVKQAIGFDVSRGDQVTVTNAAFKIAESMEVLPEPPLWEQSWFIDLIKQVVAVVVVLLLVMGVIRPVMRGLVVREESEAREKNAATAASAEVRYDENGNVVALTAGGEETNIEALEKEDLLLLDAPQSYEKRLEYVKKLVDEDAKLVAQAVKMWVVANG